MVFLSPKVGLHALSPTRRYTLESFGHKLWSLGDRRSVGTSLGRRIDGRSQPRCRLRRQLYRYCGCLRGWPERTPDRSSKEGPQRRDRGGDQGGPPPSPPTLRKLPPSHLDSLDSADPS